MARPSLSFEEKIEAQIRANENEDLIARLRTKAMDSVVNNMMRAITHRIASGKSTYTSSSLVSYECDDPVDISEIGNKEWMENNCRHFRFKTVEELEIIRKRLEVESKGCAMCRVIETSWGENRIECDLQYERPEFPKPLVEGTPEHSFHPMERGVEV